MVDTMLGAKRIDSHVRFFGSADRTAVRCKCGLMHDMHRIRGFRASGLELRV